MRKTAGRGELPGSNDRSGIRAEIAPGLAAMKALYRTVLLIRRAEERIKDLSAEGLVPGFIHLSIGQEAVAAGVMSALAPDDTIASTHRAHGHAIAKGVPLAGLFAELLARDEGVCRGRGGSMHVADLSRGMLGANGIVAAGLPIAVGSALAHKSLKRPRIAVAFFGDGALGEGLVHECFNLAMLWRLPVLFVCENNGWGEFSPSSTQLAFALADLAKAYRLPHRSVDGNDVAAVAAAAGAAADRVRRGDGPHLLECVTTRMRGHYEGDPQRYRDPAEIAGLAARDCVAIAARALRGLGASAAAIGKIDREVERLVAGAVDVARNAREPSFEAAASDVYTAEAG
jgi:pyruvate dehydrogenase E1 component alpha subunit